jgi:molybdenum cofactor biosynthesis enzyme MoaA
MLTISKGLWSGCVKFKRFSAIIYCMAKPSKMETIGKGLDSLDQVARKIPAVELNSKDLKRVEIQGSEPLVNNDFENAQEEIENITGEIKSKLNVVHPERKPNVVETKKEEEQSESHSRNYARKT